MPDTTILTAEELASIRRPFRGARLLPGRAYHDEAIHEWEREHFLRHDWVIVGREAEAPEAGTFFTTELDGEPLLVVRGRDDQLRAFYNVCQHRGTAVVEEPCGKAVRFQCPYHAWIYDLEGNLVRAKHTEDLEDFSLAEYGLNEEHVRDSIKVRTHGPWVPGGAAEETYLVHESLLRSHGEFPCAGDHEALGS